MVFQRKDSNTAFATLSRHDEYYINGGDLYLLVEHVAFRVHGHFFERESPLFKGQLSIPASPGAQRLGTSDSNAIILDGVKASDFAKFLWVFYNPKYSLYKAPVQDWVVILGLAHNWQFPEVKELCIREMQKLQMPDVDRVAAYNKFGVDSELLVPCYANLVKREAPISLDEGIQMGMEITIRLTTAREHARANPVPPSGARSPVEADLKDDEMERLVRNMLGIPAAMNMLPITPKSVMSPLPPISLMAAAAQVITQLSPAPPCKKEPNPISQSKPQDEVSTNATTTTAPHDITPTTPNDDVNKALTPNGTADAKEAICTKDAPNNHGVPNGTPSVMGIADKAAATATPATAAISEATRPEEKTDATDKSPATAAAEGASKADASSKPDTTEEPDAADKTKTETSTKPDGKAAAGAKGGEPTSGKGAEAKKGDGKNGATADQSEAKTDAESLIKEEKVSGASSPSTPVAPTLLRGRASTLAKKRN